MTEQRAQHHYDHMPNGLDSIIREFLFLKPSEKIRELILEGINEPNSKIKACAVLFIPSSRNPDQILMHLDDDNIHMSFIKHINELIIPTDSEWKESLIPYSKALAERGSPVAGIIYKNEGTMLRMAGDLTPQDALQKIQKENKKNLVQNN